MTWKHAGKTKAFDLCTLDKELSQQHDIKLPTQCTLGKIKLTHQAVVMLASLNHYDQAQVIREMEFVTRNPTHPGSMKHSRNPFWWIYRTKYPFKQYHYLIEYKLNTNHDVVITDILFDKNLTGIQQSASAERTMLYEAQRGNSMSYDQPMTADDIRNLSSAWHQPKPVTQVRTDHAAVNGMQNNLTKATWLMGVHAQAAYSSDSFDRYTLFHNPNDNFALDGIECAYDKRRGNKSHNAQHLASVLHQCQSLGRHVKWTAHSQGVIIFNAALEHYRLHYTAPLASQQLTPHGSGANLARLQQSAQKVGLKLNPARNNPFDPVPNLLALNSKSASSLARCITTLLPTALWDSPAKSAHTLPYLGAESYHQQLLMIGAHRRARRVQKYIEKHAN